MAPTMQVACKAFIAPTPRHGPRKSATRVFPQSKAGPPRWMYFSGNALNEATHKIGISHILLDLLPKCDILVAARR